MSFRIALVGESDFMKTRLAEILRSSGFDVDFCAVDAAVFDRRLHGHDLIVVSTDVTAKIEENKWFESMLDTPAFLILDEHGGTRSREQSFLIHPEMSPEDIMATVNSLIYLTSNQRKSPRIKVSLPVEYECEGRIARSTVMDLGENGLFISTLAPPATGSRITVRFTLPGTAPEIIARGRVAYSIGCDLDRSIISHPSSPDRRIIAMPGIGVMIDEIRGEDRAAVTAYIRNHR